MTGREHDAARVEKVRNVMLRAILDDPLGRRLFEETASGRSQIEVTVRLVIAVDAMFGEWGEPFAFRDRFVLGITHRYAAELHRAEQMAQWALHGPGQPASAGELRAMLGLDTPPDGV